MLDNLKGLLIKETVWLNTLRSLCAGIVWMIISFFMPNNGNSPFYVKLIFPIAFSFVLLMFYGIAQILKMFNLGGSGNIMRMLIAVTGDPLLYLLFKLKAEIVLAKRWNVVNHSINQLTKKTNFICFFFTFYFCLFIYSASAQSEGDFDNSFGKWGIVKTHIGWSDAYGYSVAIQADRKIIVAGNSFTRTSSEFALTRYNEDGTLDNTFSSDGIVTTGIGSGDSWGESVAIQADGKIVVAGYSSNGTNYDFALVRYNSDGALDTTFSSDGIVTTGISSSHDLGQSVTIQADGKIIVAGFSNNGVFREFALVRYNSDGTLDNTFSSDGIVTTDIGISDDFGYSVAIQTDGKIIVAGYSNNGKNDDFALVRYNSDGTLDNTFSLDGKVTTDFGGRYDSGFSVKIQTDGKIIVAGGSSNDFALARYNVDGTLDNTFSSDGKVTTGIGSGDDCGLSIAIQADGKIIMAGYSEGFLALARYNVDGTLDNTFSSDGIVTINNTEGFGKGNSVAIQEDGKILVAGYLYNYLNHKAEFAVVRFLNFTTNTGIEKAELNKTLKIYPNPVSDELIIEIKGNTKNTNFEIINSIGKVVFKGFLLEKTVVQTASFFPGIYLIKFESGKTFEFKKIVKK